MGNCLEIARNGMLCAGAEEYEKRIQELERDKTLLVQKYHVYSKRIEELEEEVETLRMQLAGCGVVAMSNTHESAKKAREMDQRYKCASIDDVAACVDREIMWRECAKKAEATLERVHEVIDNWLEDEWVTCDGEPPLDVQDCIKELKAAIKGEG